MSLLFLKLSIVYDKVTKLMDTVLNQTFLSTYRRSINWIFQLLFLHVKSET